MKDPNAPAEGIFGHVPIIVALVLASFVGWVLWWAVRYVRADAMTRQSIRQAVRVRWGWKRLAPMLKLSATDKTPTALASLANTQGKPTKPRVLIPTLKVKHDAYGAVGHAEPFAKLLGAAPLDRHANDDLALTLGEPPEQLLDIRCRRRGL